MRRDIDSHVKNLENKITVFFEKPVSFKTGVISAKADWWAKKANHHPRRRHPILPQGRGSAEGGPERSQHELGVGV